MPRNMMPSSTTIQIMVFAALGPAGSRNAVVPLLMASTPVSAVHPALKARMKIQTIDSPARWRPCSVPW